ncbi:VCBS repeat-containing protein [Flavicella sp.]|uniref:VCBS repeat-containing protein n=1 Tax=Flavicella sp. TaxID=2957742 RepID=UPI00261FBEC5|nr:VCBS repeat-containing protein [Flavicella sp.]MDG1804051.1 VCBS repeat-containing protein [Flavicella sp.]
MFSNINSGVSGLSFSNDLKEDVATNYYKYMYLYIGGGVAAGDINNDGLVDLFFTSNTGENKLFLNKGGLKFKDITTSSGIKHKDGFDTGVTMVDVNADGYLDIYVSRGGWKDDGDKFSNLLFINNGDLTFSEKAKELGVADDNRTIQATFFDFDNDNDLDVYVSNSPDIDGKIKILDLKKADRNPENARLKGNDHLYENDGTGHFTDISKKSGLLTDLGFGLNPQVGDLNNDGWLDLYVCNDFNYPDLVYINNKKGGFVESRDAYFKHMSFNSMGSDYADINNDGLEDLMTLDMNPEDYIRSKTTMGMTSIENFESMVKNGYHYQYMHNMLQLNNGQKNFSEISKMAGVANTDWSWSILSADFDLDGFNDFYITNGVYRDVIDRDTNNKILSILRKNGRKPTPEDFLLFTKMLPQQKLNNYFFKNNGDLTFENTSDSWYDNKPTFSNGAIYADLDNDGDLDIVVNNINEKATLLKNNAVEQQLGEFLRIELKGPEKNKFGAGAKVKIKLSDNSTQIRQLTNTRGFLSSVSNILSFGIKKGVKIENLEVQWLDGKSQALEEINVNETLVLKYSNAQIQANDRIKSNTLFKEHETQENHKDPYYNDYEVQVLLPHKLSQTGPCIAKGDVNGDGVDDVYVGGGHTQAGRLLIAGETEDLKWLKNNSFVKDKVYEDTAATFFDADNDGDLDLYVVSGSYEFKENSEVLLDRLYLNNSKGYFTRAKNNIPKINSAGGVVISTDLDNDGDLDLFVGGRVIPGKYPYAPKSYLLINNHGKFSVETQNIAPELEELGMVTDAKWADLNGDGFTDLIVCGEWMGLEVFINERSKLVKSKDFTKLNNAKGWWNKILIEDVDEDGDLDIIAGNLGLNYKFKATKEKPFHVYTSDFDFNGVEDVFLAKEYKNKQVPIRGKSCSTQQLPHLKNKIKSYQKFANSDLAGIVGPGIQNALHYEANEFRSGIFINDNNKFVFKPFSNEAQYFPINSILFNDFDKDGKKDLLMAGNNYQSEVETTKSDAGIGVLMKGNGKGDFEYVNSRKTGVFANKDVRGIVYLENKSNPLVYIINNNDRHQIFYLNKK